LEILAQKRILADIDRVAGTSAGAITAGLLAVGYTDQEIQNILQNTSFKDFMDGSFLDGWGMLKGSCSNMVYGKARSFVRGSKTLLKKALAIKPLPLLNWLTSLKQSPIKNTAFS